MWFLRLQGDFISSENLELMPPLDYLVLCFVNGLEIYDKVHVQGSLNSIQHNYLTNLHFDQKSILKSMQWNAKAGDQ